MNTKNYAITVEGKSYPDCILLAITSGRNGAKSTINIDINQISELISKMRIVERELKNAKK